MNCDHFFFLNKKTKLVEVSLDNLDYEPIPAKTDYKYSVWVLVRKREKNGKFKNFWKHICSLIF